MYQGLLLTKTGNPDLSVRFLATASSGIFARDVARTLNRDPDESMTYVPSKKHSRLPDHEHVIIVKGAASRAGVFPPILEPNASMITAITSQATVARTMDAGCPPVL